MSVSSWFPWASTPPRNGTAQRPQSAIINPNAGAYAAPATAYRDEPRGPARGIIDFFRRFTSGWTGPATSKGTDSDRDLREERVRSGPEGIVLPWFLPYFDPTQTQFETEQMRLAYRKMMADPNVKAALLGKILAVSALDLDIIPAGKDPRHQLVADFVRWNLTESLTGGFHNLVWSVLSGGLVDGYSVNEKVWDVESRGEWALKYYLRQLKPKDVGHDIVLETDDYRNVVGLRGLRYNPGTIYHPSGFVIYRHLPMYDVPTGTSDLRACYDDQTEILTKMGWKLFADLDDDDEVASLDRSDGSEGKLVYQRPLRRISYHYKGRMFCQESIHADVCVTPDHRLFVAKRGRGLASDRGPWEFVEAQRIMDGSFPKVHYYKRDADWEGQEVAEFVLPEHRWSQRIANRPGSDYGMRTTVQPARTLVMDDWLRFLGIYLAEGSCYRVKRGNHQASVMIHQNPGPVFDEIKRLVERLGFAYCVQKSGPDRPCLAVRISSLQLYTYLHPLGKSYTKHIPAEFKALSRRQLNILLEWMMRGDGRHNGTQYCTVSRRLADDVSEVILKCGFAPLTYQETNETRTINIVSKNTKGISANEVNRLNDHRSWKEYDGMVHCVTVPQGVVYVRRNGRSVWCGNCYSRWWLLDSVLKIRAVGLEKRSLPVLWATFQSSSQRPSLEAALAKMRSQNWLAVPEGVRVEALNIAGSADSQFSDAVKDLKHDIFLGIAGAILQALEGTTTDGRGNSQVHRSTADLFIWHLARAIEGILNDRHNGLIRDIVDLNYAVDAYPRAVLGAVDVDELKAELAIDEGLSRIGLKLSVADVYNRYGRTPPEDEEDTLAPGGGAGGGGPGGDAGGLAGMLGGGGPEEPKEGGDEQEPEEGSEPAEDPTAGLTFHAERFSGDWEEGKHPRNKGKFAKKGQGGGAKGKDEPPKEPASKNGGAVAPAAPPSDSKGQDTPSDEKTAIVNTSVPDGPALETGEVKPLSRGAGLQHGTSEFFRVSSGGKSYFVKKIKGSLRGRSLSRTEGIRNEVVTESLARLAGVNAPACRAVQFDGSSALASEWLNGESIEDSYDTQKAVLQSDKADVAALALFAFMADQGDRHAGNYFFSGGKVHTIDHEFGFHSVNLKTRQERDTHAADSLAENGLLGAGFGRGDLVPIPRIVLNRMIDAAPKMEALLRSEGMDREADVVKERAETLQGLTTSEYQPTVATLIHRLRPKPEAPPAATGDWGDLEAPPVEPAKPRWGKLRLDRKPPPPW